MISHTAGSWSLQSFGVGPGQNPRPPAYKRCADCGILTKGRRRMNQITKRLFRKANIVNVEVQTINGRPRFYKILDVTGSFDRN
jgi:hypothetical protein